MAGRRIVGRNEASFNERMHDQVKAAGVAARHGDFLRVLHFFALRCREFRQAVNPVRIGAVCGAGIQNARALIGWIKQRDRFLGCRIGQAQKYHVGRVDELGLDLGVLALGFGDGEDFDFAAALQALVDLQTRGAVAAVDKYLECHGVSPAIDRAILRGASPIAHLQCKPFRAQA